MIVCLQGRHIDHEISRKRTHKRDLFEHDPLIAQPPPDHVIGLVHLLVETHKVKPHPIRQFPISPVLESLIHRIFPVFALDRVSAFRNHKPIESRFF